MPFVLLNIFLPSAYSKHVSLWCENVGGEDALGCAGSLYTPDVIPSKNENCQK